MRKLDQSTRNWLKRQGLTQSVGNQVGQHLYGAPLMEALSGLQSAHLTPYGNTRTGALRELARILAAEDQFKTVAHLFAGRR